MFIEIPVSCMSVRAAKIDRGMLTAATSVERRLNRNRKIVRIAKSAPSPPSRTSPSRDSTMKPDRSRHGQDPDVGAAGLGSRQLGLNGLCDGDRVGAGRLGHRDRDRGLAIRSGVTGRGKTDLLDRAQLADRDRGDRQRPATSGTRRDGRRGGRAGQARHPDTDHEVGDRVDRA